MRKELLKSLTDAPAAITSNKYTSMEVDPNFADNGLDKDLLTFRESGRLSGKLVTTAHDALTGKVSIRSGVALKTTGNCGW